MGTQSNPDAPVYVKTVGIVAPSAEVDVELTLPAGAYTVQVKASHWLRAEGIVLTSAPWIFAAPTGADKVTVYWDPVPNATGYRVRWGTASGIYPNVSSVQPADARMLSITGLTSEQEYYFVVEAERNGVWSAPSDEDSAIPHVGAIPWDSWDATRLITAVEAQALPEMRAGPYDDVWVAGPDGRIYTRSGSFPSDGEVSLQQNIIASRNGEVFVLPSDNWGELSTLQTTLPADAGPYRRVRAPAGFEGVKGSLYLPAQVSLRQRVTNLKIPHRRADGTIEKVWAPNQRRYDGANTYIGSHEHHGGEVDAGLRYNPEMQRWMPFLIVKLPQKRDPAIFPDAGGREVDASENRLIPGQWATITYFVGDDTMHCNITGRNMYWETITIRLRAPNPHSSRASIQVKRVHSISHVIGWINQRTPEERKWYPTGSSVTGMAWDFGQYWDGLTWRRWTTASENGSYPQRGHQSIIDWNERAPYWWEDSITIRLPTR